MDQLLHVENLTVEFPVNNTFIKVVDGMTFSVKKSGILGVVGESGSGKSISFLSIMGLVDKKARVTASVLNFNGSDLLSLSSGKRLKMLGKNGMGIIFQDPMSSLNPAFTIGYQLLEALRLHDKGHKEAYYVDKALSFLDKVGISDGKKRLEAYPHHLSGGMCQRVMIAMAIACSPALLIADEPTTALDVTLQVQVIDLLLRLQEENNMALILISHDLGLVSNVCQEVMVMYCGQIFEMGQREIIFTHPRHPYTQALFDSLPGNFSRGERLKTIPGVVPSVLDRPLGCLLHPRCRYADRECMQLIPYLHGSQIHSVRCHHPL